VQQPQMPRRTVLTSSAAGLGGLTVLQVAGPAPAFPGRARDYVTIREQQRGETVWTFHTVSHDRLKPAPAKVTRRGDRHTVHGAAWAPRSPGPRYGSTAAGGTPPGSTGGGTRRRGRSGRSTGVRRPPASTP
jgi:hypothetical protein